MNREQALQQIRAHERIAAGKTTPAAKRVQHLESARYLRERFRLPTQVVKAVPPAQPLVNEGTSRGAEAQRTEADRIRKWKEGR